MMGVLTPPTGKTQCRGLVPAPCRLSCIEGSSESKRAGEA